MRGVELFMGLMIACATSAIEAPVALAQQRDCVPPRSSSPPDSRQMASDEHYTGCRGLPGTCHGRCEGDQYCRTLVSSDGKRYCGCAAIPPETPGYAASKLPGLARRESINH
jgi:hypothetical protein